MLRVWSGLFRMRDFWLKYKITHCERDKSTQGNALVLTGR